MSCTCLVLIVDDKHLRESKDGKLLLATSIDGNNKIYLFRFVIVNKDISSTYCGCILSTEKVYDLVIMFEKHLSICKAIKLCLSIMLKYHLGKNLKTKI